MKHAKTIYTILFEVGRWDYTGFFGLYIKSTHIIYLL